MRVTERPLQHSPWAQNQEITDRPGADRPGADRPGAQSTNRLIAIAFAAMVTISAITLLVNGVN